MEMAILTESNEKNLHVYMNEVKGRGTELVGDSTRISLLSSTKEK